MTLRSLVALVGGVLVGACMGGGCSTLASQEQKVAEVRARKHVVSLTLRAVAKADGRDSFSFNGRPEAPILRASPGDQLDITYINDLPPKPREACAIGPCMDMTNLHFHGLEISPNAPQDDVLDMIAMPGQKLHYRVEIPKDHPPGLYWYHTHPHGESFQQVRDGMSGAIVIEGTERYVPRLRGMREQIIMVRGREIKDDPQAAKLEQQVEMSSKSCGSEAEPPEEIFTVNGTVRPRLAIAPGERQFWRVVNASADRYLDLEVPGASFEVVAMDGMPVAYHDPDHPTRMVEHVFLAPAGRVEAIVTGPSGRPGAALRSRCVDTGPDGDPNPAMVLADLVSGPASSSAPNVAVNAQQPPAYRRLDLSDEEKAAPRFVVTFTEDKNGFYINDKKFAPDDAPLVQVKIGSYQHWQIVNASGEVHPFHIHQTHFLAYAENGHPVADPMWLDTVNVPFGGTADVIIDFTNPVIKGMSLFHCHLLNHEDKGMMAKVLFQ